MPRSQTWATYILVIARIPSRSVTPLANTIASRQQTWLPARSYLSDKPHLVRAKVQLTGLSWFLRVNMELVLETKALQPRWEASRSYWPTSRSKADRMLLKVAVIILALIWSTVRYQADKVTEIDMLRKWALEPKTNRPKAWLPAWTPSQLLPKVFISHRVAIRSFIHSIELSIKLPKARTAITRLVTLRSQIIRVCRICELKPLLVLSITWAVT